MAPPPLPLVMEIATAEPRWNPGTRTVALIAGGYLAAALAAVLVADATGRSVGSVLAGAPVPGLGLLAVFYLGRRRAPAPAVNAEQVSFHKVLWTRRMQVREHAWFCSACRVAFWPAGVLKAAFPASPAVPAHGFPLAVVTLAEQAYGQP